MGMMGLKNNQNKLVMSKGPATIMNSRSSELKKIVQKYLDKLDQYQQNAPKDKEQFFVDSFNQLEQYFICCDGESFVDDTVRNSIRMLIKETEKMASITFNPDKD
jgi:hypothetical protein